MMKIKAQVIKVSLIIYNESRVNTYSNDFGLHNTHSQSSPDSVYNNNQVKVEIIKRKTIGNTYNIKDLRGYCIQNSYMGDYSQQTIRENVQVNKQKQHLDYES